MIAKKIRELLSESGWRQETDWGWRFRWTDGEENVVVSWMDGASKHSGWFVEVERPDGPTLSATNGFVSLHEALVLADFYMSAGHVVSAIQQEGWLAENAESYDFDVIDPGQLDATRPTIATP